MQREKQRLRSRCSRALCCSCRLSVSSASDQSSGDSERLRTISSISHAMVQQRLEEMIAERRRREERMRRRRMMVVMVAVEKASYDPREDFRESMEEVIAANGIREPRELRRLLGYYVSANSREFRGVILEVFYQVCTDLFGDSGCKFVH